MGQQHSEICEIRWCENINIWGGTGFLKCIPPPSPFSPNSLPLISHLQPIHFPSPFEAAPPHPYIAAKSQKHWGSVMNSSTKCTHNIQWNLTYPDTSVPKLTVWITEYMYLDKWVTFYIIYIHWFQTCEVSLYFICLMKLQVRTIRWESG